MATERSTVAHIVETLAGGGRPVSARAMFGEYALYCDGKVVGLICDETLFLKDRPVVRAVVEAPDLGPPYPGAKPHILADALLNDPETLQAVVRAIADDLPAPKPKKPRQKP
ncbi:TfoX/Sxy family protein [Pararhodobacter sp.]|uniref:TfoX/Sxy family protein n=1 Tax=Pararhodobacter sp. TaxID=2127056 RepID=UPI002AFEA825|nr:TfoX/Sxy family protein [Pararhodobacter sp.]